MSRIVNLHLNRDSCIIRHRIFALDSSHETLPYHKPGPQLLLEHENNPHLLINTTLGSQAGKPPQGPSSLKRTARGCGTTLTGNPLFLDQCTTVPMHLAFGDIGDISGRY
ncbi:hypothetical protein GGS23DRAFT_594969 [Durotheca rogersii]|uniref:uncharacterized protein n=1 Tax=Durotheca rogersii TaxID=419775 RepID=UPI00221FF641|nr:uncharacterized protein GGS23DRAFT_594969 [Durotheca rogersii]KAI5865443.1 hypothetical protein GGS23DRAFT_594969 [Durotheca rogersii]